jgi:hypothetical protein
MGTGMISCPASARQRELAGGQVKCKILDKSNSLIIIGGVRINPNGGPG